MKVIAKIIGIIVVISAAIGAIAFVADRAKDKNSKHKAYGPYEKYIKRPMDAFLSAGALIVLSPVLIITAIGETETWITGIIHTGSSR